MQSSAAFCSDDVECFQSAPYAYELLWHFQQLGKIELIVSQQQVLWAGFVCLFALKLQSLSIKRVPGSRKKNIMLKGH